MKHAVWLGLLFVVILSAPALATPPVDIKLEYDAVASVLHVTARHVSQHLEKHFLRKMVVSLNGKQRPATYYHRQPSPSGFDQSLSITAGPNDVIGVELFCSEGGSQKTALTVPQPPKKALGRSSTSVIASEAKQSHIEPN